MLNRFVLSLLVVSALAGSYDNADDYYRYGSPSRLAVQPGQGSAAGQFVPKAPIPITRHEMQNDHRGNYKLDYETGEGTRHSVQGVLKMLSDNSQVVVQSGTITWRSPEGIVHTLNYVADEHGFRATGDHLPTPPPVPAEIQQSLQANSNVEYHEHEEHSYYGYETPHQSTNTPSVPVPVPAQPSYSYIPPPAPAFSDYGSSYYQPAAEQVRPPAPPTVEEAQPPAPPTEEEVRPPSTDILPTQPPVFVPETTFRPLPVLETTQRPLPPVEPPVPTTSRPLPQSTFRPITVRPPRPRPPTEESPIFPGSQPTDSINVNFPGVNLPGANVIQAPDVPILLGPGNGNFRTFVNLSHVFIDSDNTRTVFRIHNPSRQRL